jgi:hypothetical protein
LKNKSSSFSNVKSSKFVRKPSSLRSLNFVRDHRGGPLTLFQHKKLMQWAINCSNHILLLNPQLIYEENNLIKNLLLVGEEWTADKKTCGDCRKESVKAIKFARKKNSLLSKKNC